MKKKRHMKKQLHVNCQKNLNLINLSMLKKQKEKKSQLTISNYSQ